jgi:hypothetical protein
MRTAFLKITTGIVRRGNTTLDQRSGSKGGGMLGATRNSIPALATREPLHDQSSHGADAFRYFAIGAKPPRPPAPKPVVQRRGPREYVGVWT